MLSEKYFSHDDLEMEPAELRRAVTVGALPGLEKKVFPANPVLFHFIMKQLP
jgi:hypothetical protein